MTKVDRNLLAVRGPGSELIDTVCHSNHPYTIQLEEVKLDRAGLNLVGEMLSQRLEIKWLAGLSIGHQVTNILLRDAPPGQEFDDIALLGKRHERFSSAAAGQSNHEIGAMRRTSLLWEVYVLRFEEALERYRKPSLAGRLAFSAAALRRRALWVAGGEDTDPDPRRYPSLQGAAAAGARSDAGVDA